MEEVTSAPAETENAIAPERPCYLRNAWYMAAWAHELDEAGLVARTVCGTRLVLLKSGDSVAALTDACPHRFAPLSRGRLVKGGVQCGYHGLTFGIDGRCIHNPHGPVTRVMKVTAYPTLKAYQGLWVWLGKPERADPALLPNLAVLDEERAAAKGGYLHGMANYQLYADNILDLSHVDYLHADISGGNAVTGTEQKVTEEGSSIRVRWTKAKHKALPLEAKIGLVSDDVFDRHTEVVWQPPGIMVLNVLLEKPGSAPRKIRSAVHVMTPESMKTTHYFWMFTRGPTPSDDDAMYTKFAAEGERVFLTEDGPMIAAVQTVMGTRDLFELHPLLLRSDEAAVRARRKLSALIAAEKES